MSGPFNYYPENWGVVSWNVSRSFGVGLETFWTKLREGAGGTGYDGGMEGVQAAVTLVRKEELWS